MDAITVGGKLPANGGSQAGSVTASVVDISLGFSSGIDPSVPGTSDNIVGPEPGTNLAMGFYRVGTAYADGSFQMDGFDFTSLSGVSISFAYNSESSFTWDTNLEVDYRIDGGAWQDIPENQNWNPGWTVANIIFPSALDGANHVDLRIREVSWLSTFGYLDLDNVQIHAVPEPSAGLLVVFGIALVCARAVGKRSACAMARFQAG